MKKVIAYTRVARQHWEHPCDELPYLMVPMSDGRVIRYNPEIQHTGISQVLEKRSHDLKKRPNGRIVKVGYAYHEQKD